MQHNIAIIYKKFVQIKGKGWIKSMHPGATGIGYTLESLLGKKEDANPIPDYCGFEIKAIRTNSNGKIHLLNLAPKGQSDNSFRKILDNLAYPNKKNPNLKSFCIDVNAKYYRNIGYHKKVILNVNREKERIEFVAYKYGKLLDLELSWSFKELEQRLYQKIKYLCIIEAKNKFVYSEEFFYYNKIYFYKFFGFRTFLKLLEMGLITVNFKVDCYDSNKNYISNHGTDFTIKLSYIKYLFKKI